MQSSIKHKLYTILEFNKENRLSKITGFIIFSLIVLNVLFVIIESIPAIHSEYKLFFYYFEIFSVIIFTVEYLSRVFVCTENPKYGKSVKGRLKFVLSPMALVDLFAILPFYLPLLLPVNLIFLRIFRLFRILRILKLARYSRAFSIMRDMLTKKKEELGITLFAILIIFILSSCLMYLIENSAQPDKFTSIPATMWWCIATLSTVGYGDIYPITALGKILGAVTAVLGIGFFALPAGILGSGFIEQAQEKKSKKCPHCGKEV